MTFLSCLLSPHRNVPEQRKVCIPFCRKSWKLILLNHTCYILSTTHNTLIYDLQLPSLSPNSPSPATFHKLATMTTAGGKHLLKKRVQNGQKELGLCKWMSEKKDLLPKQVQWMAWWFQHVSFWNHLLPYQSRGSFWRSLSQMKTQECIKHLHFNFSLLLYLSPQLWGLYPKGCTCLDEGLIFPLNYTRTSTLRHQLFKTKLNTKQNKPLKKNHSE